MISDIDIPIIRIREGFDDLALPSYETPASVGMDLRAAIVEPVELAPGCRALIPSGIAVAIPENCEGQVRPRSGLAVKHGIGIVNSPGTIDSDYRGEIRVALINHGSESFTVERGERIAQLVIAPILRARLQKKDSLEDTERGEGGFGHTGR